MQNHLFDLQAGESLRLGTYKVTLLEIEDGAAVLEIEGPDGGFRWSQSATQQRAKKTEQLFLPESEQNQPSHPESRCRIGGGAS